MAQRDALLLLLLLLLFPRQVHGSAEAADAARQPVAWGELVLLVWRVTRRPVMWLLVGIGVLWGE
jgi:hypothetical protein